MPNDVIFVLTQRHRVFDGTNLDDIVDAIIIPYPNSTVTASANYPGASATFQVTTDTPLNGGQEINFSVGDGWLISMNERYPAEVLANEAFVVPLADFIAGQLPVPAALTLAVGYAVVPSLVVSASATVTVPMVPALPDAGYSVAVALAGSAQLLGALAILGHTVVDADTVEVTVQNNGLLTLGGATVLVTALHNG